MEAIDVIKNLFSTCLIIISSLCYCYFISSRLPKGIFRLTSIIPIVIIFTILLPSVGPSPSPPSSPSLAHGFKLLLFAFDQGPLSSQRSKLSMLIFITIAVLPIIITKEKKYPPKKMKFPLNLAIKAFLFPLLAEFLINYRGTLSPLMLIVLFSVFIMFLVDILFFCYCSIGTYITGLEIDQPSNKPHLSTSVQEFWGKRWNAPVSNILYSTICFPVRSASEKVLGKGLCSTCVGVMASFVVSGLMHELLYYHMTLVATSWEVTLYFVMHGVVVSIEIVFKKRAKDKLRLNWFVSWLLTVGFVSISSWMVQFPQLIRSGVDLRLLEEYQICVEYLKTKILDLSPLSGVTNLS
ncbi:hypothetical protein Leryth_014920 [Lithospermum erythrorhizon]|nr:hypothetical protein Leryth_014920 [Lithospermum erythrorhizon]